MRSNWLAAGLLMLALAPLAQAQKSRYSSSSSQADALAYPVVLHVTRSWLEGSPASRLHLEVVSDGIKLELAANAAALLHPGDYRARVLANEEKKSGWFTRSYELLFADGTHVVFNVVAESQP